jgi:hypothetical protein
MDGWMGWKNGRMDEWMSGWRGLRQTAGDIRSRGRERPGSGLGATDVESRHTSTDHYIWREQRKRSIEARRAKRQENNY